MIGSRANDACRFAVARLGAVVALSAVTVPVLAQAPGRTPPARLSFYGDAKAPDISGVWTRVDAAPAVNGATASKEGWLPWPPPLKAPYAATWQKRVAGAAAGTRTDDPVRACLPPGMPRFMSGTNGPLLIVQTPGRVMVVRDGLPVRRIWLDARPLPAAKDLEDFYSGNSKGRYEGGNLVTEVIGIKDQPIDGTGVPHSGDLKVVERFHRVDANTLRVTLTLTDRTAYTKPMTTTVTYKSVDASTWEPKEVLCTSETNYHPETYVR